MSISLKIRNSEDVVLRQKAQLRVIPGEVLGLEYRITTDGLLGFSLMTLYFLYFEVKDTLLFILWSERNFGRRLYQAKWLLQVLPSAHPEDWSHGLWTTASRLLQSYIELERWRSRWSLGRTVLHTTVPAGPAIARRRALEEHLLECKLH